jgi:hypothetical protein
MWAEYFQTYAKKAKVAIVGDAAITVSGLNQKENSDLY